MIPEDELLRLEGAVADACNLALDGQILAGYEVLDLALAWAEAPAIHPVTGQAAPPEPWAEELILRHRRALMSFASSNGVVCTEAGYTLVPLEQRVDAQRKLARELCQQARRISAAAREAKQRRAALKACYVPALEQRFPPAED